MQSGQRPRPVRELVGNHAITEARIGLLRIIGVNEYLVAVTADHIQYPADQCPALQSLQTLVAAYAPAQAAGQDDR